MEKNNKYIQNPEELEIINKLKDKFTKKEIDKFNQFISKCESFEGIIDEKNNELIVDDGYFKQIIFEKISDINFKDLSKYVIDPENKNFELIKSSFENIEKQKVELLCYCNNQDFKKINFEINLLFDFIKFLSNDKQTYYVDQGCLDIDFIFFSKKKNLYNTFFGWFLIWKNKNI